MSDVLVGSAHATMELRYQQFSEGVSIVEQQIERLQSFAKTPIIAQVQLGAGGASASGPALAGASSAGASPSVAPQSVANAAALSREALAAGDAARALELMDQVLGKTSTDTKTNTDTSLAAVRAEAGLAVALGDRTRAIELLEGALAGQSARTTAVISTERQLATIENQAITAAQRQADNAVRVAQQQARAAVATKDYAGALQILHTAQIEQAGASATVLAGLETQVATLETAGTITGQFGAQLAGLVSPIALVGVGLGLVTKTAQSFGDALHFAGQLQEERTAFGGILGDFRNGNAILDEAAQRTRVYGFTTKETTDAFRELAPIIRESTSSTRDQAEALARISVLKPDDPVRALTGAIEGIKTGRFRELSKELGLSVAEQQQLKTSTDEGKDSFLALNEVLDRHGITLAVAKERTEGLVGAERRQAQAAEDLQKAQAGFASGPGLALLEQRIKITDDATQAFGGSLIGLNNVVGDSVGTFNPLLGAITSYNNAVLGAGRDALVWTGIIQGTTPEVLGNTRANQANGVAIDQAAQLAQQASAAQLAYADSLGMAGVQARAAALANQQKADSDKLASIDAQTHALAQKQLDDQVTAAANALLAEGPAGARMAALLAQSSGGVDVLTAAQYRLLVATNAANNAQNQKDTNAVVATNRAFDRPSGREGGSDAVSEGEAFVTALQKQQAEQQKLLDSEIALAGAKKQTAREIELLRQKQSQYAKGTAEFNQIEAQIVGIQLSGGKARVSAAESTALQLQNVEQNSGLQLLKTQRENLERLRDQAEDFDVRRSRAQEDFAEKRRMLLEKGEKGQAARLSAEFAKDQRREQEDFDRQKRRTLRNNAEGTGDIGARADLRGQQIGTRAALRGVRTSAGGATPPDLGDAPPRLGEGGAPSGGGGVLTLRVQIAPLSVQFDGHQVVEVIYPEIEQRIDASMADAAGVIVVGSGQPSVAGFRP
jgi:hypothetical protein